MPIGIGHRAVFSPKSVAPTNGLVERKGKAARLEERQADNRDLANEKSAPGDRDRRTFGEFNCNSVHLSGSAGRRPPAAGAYQRVALHRASGVRPASGNRTTIFVAAGDRLTVESKANVGGRTRTTDARLSELYGFSG